MSQDNMMQDVYHYILNHRHGVFCGGGLMQLVSTLLLPKSKVRSECGKQDTHLIGGVDNVDNVFVLGDEGQRLEQRLEIIDFSVTGLWNNLLGCPKGMHRDLMIEKVQAAVIYRQTFLLHKLTELFYLEWVSLAGQDVYMLRTLAQRD